MSDTPAEFPQTPRTTTARDRDQVSYERLAAYAAIDEARHCHFGFLATDPATGVAEPRILPTLHVRVDDTLYLHGSTGSSPLLAARGPRGLPICVIVTHLDGLVLARSQFNHSANYRSAIAHGTARLVTDEVEKHRVLTALVEKVAAGRAADSRPPTRRELAETAVLALPLTEVSLKTRVGGVNDDPEDLDLPHWAGVVPIRVVTETPEPEPGVAVPVPNYLEPVRDPWLSAPTLSGDHVILEPLDLSHVDALFTAVADDDVYQWLPRPRPATALEMANEVRLALRMRDKEQRIPFVLRSAATGEVVGTTSYYTPDERNRSIAIGFTMIGRRWWRTGVNTESKLLLMRHAFAELGAARIEWHTDLRNIRSQRAIERLGAVREGVLRRHRPLPDGTWRDTVLYAMTDLEWPEAEPRLRGMLRPPAPVG